MTKIVGPELQKPTFWWGLIVFTVLWTRQTVVPFNQDRTRVDYLDLEREDHAFKDNRNSLHNLTDFMNTSSFLGLWMEKGSFGTLLFNIDDYIVESYLCLITDQRKVMCKNKNPKPMPWTKTMTIKRIPINKQNRKERTSYAPTKSDVPGLRYLFDPQLSHRKGTEDRIERFRVVLGHSKNS